MSEQQVEKKVLTIERHLWNRGQRKEFGHGVMLLNDEGFMCCLGFDALACGLSREDIESCEMPFDVSTEVVSLNYRKTRMVDDPYEPVCRAQTINDDKNISDEEREAQLRPILCELGWDDVVFID